MDELAGSLLRLTLVERTAGEIAFLHGEKGPGVEGLSALGVQDHLEQMEERGWVERAAGARWRITETGRQHLLAFGRWQVDIDRVVPPQGRGRGVGLGAVRGGVPHRGDRFKVNRGGDDAELPVGEVIAFRHTEVAGGRAAAELEVARVDLAPGDVLVRWDPLIEGPSASMDGGSSRSGESSLAAISFPGTYEDERNVEDIVWHVRPLTRATHPIPGFEIQTVIRGVEVGGFDFDGLEPVDSSAATAVGLVANPDLTDCVLTGDVPCVLEHDGQRERMTVSFRLDLAPNDHRSPRRKSLQLRTSRGSTSVQVDDDWFEEGLQRLEALLPVGDRLICCVTCLFSDYSPYGHGLTGMLCHRRAKEAYLSVRSKHEYWSVPVTEYVMETHLCDEYQRRVPGTGYRG